MADDLYATLNVARDADAASIKRAYLQLARETHPDKHPDDESASARFQAIGRAYSILRDEEKRKLYDAAGVVDDGTGPPTGTGAKGWYDFWRDFYSRVTTEKIDQLAAEYRGSEEEANDLRQAYTESKGSMDGIIDRMMHSTVVDEPRFRALLEESIAAGALPRLRAFAAEPDAKKQKRQAKAAKEAAEADELKKKLGLGDGPDALATAIMARSQAREGGRDSFLNSLAEKYGSMEDENGGGKARKGGGSKKGGKKAAAAAASADDPLDDAAFEALQKKMLNKGGNKKASASMADDPLDDAAFEALQKKMLAGAKAGKSRK